MRQIRSLTRSLSDRLRPLWAAVGLLAALSLAAREAPAQVRQVPGGAGAPPLGPPSVQAGNLPWVEVGEGISVQTVPKFTPLAGPTFEVIVEAPFSGHPFLEERYLLQLPAEFWTVPLKERALVIAFHQFGVSHFAPFLNSNLPNECARRNWMLLSPAGLSQTNFANVGAQLSLDTTLEQVFELLPFNPRRVYTVGFSMGGANALSYAMRKQDPKGLRVAGVVCHTGTIDVLGDALAASGPLAEIFESEFAAAPEDDPFAYERVTPAQTANFGFVVPDGAPVRNLLDVPIFFHHNTQDPNFGLLQDNVRLFQFLQGLGFDVVQDQVQAGLGVHKWSTLPVGPALDHVAGAITPPAVPTTATDFQLFSDLEGACRFVDVLELDPETVGRVRISRPAPGTNLLGISETVGIRRLALDVTALGIDPAQPVQISTSSLDGAPTELELEGFQAAPSLVLVNGQPPVAWSHDAPSATLTIQPTPNGGFGLVDVLP